MDAWNPDQLKRMQLGGNSKFNNFISPYGIPKNTEIKEKYNTKAAEFYREKIRAEVDGRSYTAPGPNEVPRPLPRPKTFAGTRNTSSISKNVNGNDWDDWGDNYNGNATNAHAQPGSEYSLSDYQASASAKEDFFARRMAENAHRPDHLPPSQGGKYVGFGSAPAGGGGLNGGGSVRGGDDDVSAMFQRGLSGLGQLAGQAAVVAKQKASQANVALKEAGVTDKLQETTSVVAEQTKVGAAKSWSFLKSAYAAAASTIEQTAAQQGVKLDLGSKKLKDQQQQGGGGGGMAGGGGLLGGGSGYQQVGNGGGVTHYDDDNEEWGGHNINNNNNNNNNSSSRNNNASGNGNGEWNGWEEGPASPSQAPVDSDWGKW
jgi:ADP-ribosylation factor GTPase-activating protein 1